MPPTVLDWPQRWDRAINVLDEGAREWSPCGAAINAAIARARALWGTQSPAQSGGMRIYLPPAPGPYFVETPIVLDDYVELHVAAGAILQSYPALASPLAKMVDFGSGTTGARVTGGGLLLGSYDYTAATGAVVGIYGSGCYECRVEGVHLAGFSSDNIYLTGGQLNRIRDVFSQEAGFYGLHLASETDAQISDVGVFSNGQSANVAGAGVGILLDSTTRVTITNPNCSDYAATFAAAQAYPIQEINTADYTLVSGLVATGNVTAQTAQLIGAHSTVWAPLSALVGTSAASGSGNAGQAVSITGGSGDGAGHGGYATLQGGVGGATAAGGNVYLNAGAGGSTDEGGGDANINGGTGGGTNGSGGNVNITAGGAGGTGTPGRVAISGVNAPSGNNGNGGRVRLQTGAGDGSGLQPPVELYAAVSVPTTAVLAASCIGFRVSSGHLVCYFNNAGSIQSIDLGALA